VPISSFDELSEILARFDREVDYLETNMQEQAADGESANSLRRCRNYVESARVKFYAGQFRLAVVFAQILRALLAKVSPTIEMV
jgi:hypothetical protein